LKKSSSLSSSADGSLAAWRLIDVLQKEKRVSRSLLAEGDAHAGFSVAWHATENALLHSDSRDTDKEKFF
jgi:hypothetical protein